MSYPYKSKQLKNSHETPPFQHHFCIHVLKNNANNAHLLGIEAADEHGNRPDAGQLAVERGPAAARLADRQLARLRQVARLALQDAARARRQLLPVAQDPPVRRLTRLHAQLASLEDKERERRGWMADYFLMGSRQRVLNDL
jgi:hypothetical protein